MTILGLVDMEAVIISRNLQIVFVLTICLAFLNSNVIYAETLVNATSVNDTDTNSSTPLETFDSNNSNNQTNNSNGSNNISTSTNSSTPQTSTSSAPASDNSNSAHGSMWVKAYDMGKINFTQIKEGGIEDIFLEQAALNDAKYKTNLTAFLSKAKNSSIRVSAWVICLKDNGNFIDPTGKYTYQVTTSSKVAVKTPYKYYYKAKVKVAYKKSVKQYYKSYYYYKGKLKYKLKYKWVKKTYYKYVYKTKYTIKYKTTYQTKYTTTTKTGYNTTYANSYINNLTSRIANYTKIDGINGIHLDYIRYAGKAYNSTNGTQAITNIVAKISAAVKAINPSALLSAALMPETSSNAYYYGQDYPTLGKYLDVLVPMIYKGNYKEDASWIASVTKYISSHSNGKPVWAGIMTYESDSNPTPLGAAELLNDTQTALNNGATGYTLFRYGNVLNNDFFDYSGNLTINSTAHTNTSSESAGNTTSSTISLATIESAASSLKSFIETNNRLPNYVTVNSQQLKVSEFLYLMANGILNLNSGKSSGVQQKTLSSDPTSSGSTLSGNLYLSDYVSLAQSIVNYINTNHAAPGSMNTSLGNMQFKTMAYTLAKILNFQSLNNRLPSYVTIDDTVYQNSTSQYLQPTKNCQSTDSTITALASSLTSGLTSTLDKATAIFNWVRNNTSYSFYYNTKYGAVNTLKNKVGNCVDLSHLLVALSRAAGIAAKYVHADATFTSGNVYGHVWAEFLIDGVWVKADATSNSNSLGNITNWNTATAKMKGTYAELPF